jgi:SAM-dependent methyltransferase
VVTVDEALAWAKQLGLNLKYEADLALLAAAGAPFVQLGLDGHTANYLLASQQFRHGTTMTWLHRVLRTFYSDFDINGMLGTYPMHVLSAAQWRVILNSSRTNESAGTLSNDENWGHLLDVGAGRGDATSELASLFSQVTVTETSKPMAKRLRKLGYTCIAEDISRRNDLRHCFDVVSLLNVLDRCDRPMSLLATARQAVRPGGLVLIALVLPYKPFVYDHGQPRGPLERLAIRSTQFEIAAAEFVTTCLLPLGLEVLALSRTPYLSGGDAHLPLYELDDLIVVCRAQGALAVIGEKTDAPGLYTTQRSR